MTLQKSRQTKINRISSGIVITKKEGAHLNIMNDLLNMRDGQKMHDNYYNILLTNRCIISHMFDTISARELQRGPKKVIERANKTQKPVIVISKNKPVGAFIGLDLLEKLQKMIYVTPPLVDEETEKRIGESVEDIKAGRFSIATTPDEIKKHLQSL